MALIIKHKKVSGAADTADAARARWVSLVEAVDVPATPGGNLIPLMSSDLLPLGVASASSLLAAGYEPFRAMDGSPVSFYSSGSGHLPEWLGYSFDAPVSVSAYTVGRRLDSPSAVYGAAYFPVSFRLQYSAGSGALLEWVDADAQSNISFELPTRVFQRTFNLAAPVVARHWRLWCAECGGAPYLQLSCFELLGAGQAAAVVQRMAMPADYEIVLTDTETRVRRLAAGGRRVGLTVGLP